MQKFILILVMLIGLTACEKKLTYSYLISHPQELKAEMDRCQTSDNNDQRCEIVLYAAANLTAIIRDQQANPEKFGQRVMDTQVQCLADKKALQTAKANLAALQKQQASAAEITSAQTEVAKAQQRFKDKREEVRMLLAVLGLGSPE
jgi:hypothetical protein